MFTVEAAEVSMSAPVPELVHPASASAPATIAAYPATRGSPRDLAG
jgi:hypothetical protein